MRIPPPPQWLMIAIVAMTLLIIAVRATRACELRFNCSSHAMTVNGKSFPIVCDRKTGQNGDGVLTGLIRASGPWRPGLVRPGTPMIATAPSLCGDCFIHVSGLSVSNGCLGTTASGFSALKACIGSKFSITRLGGQRADR
jgi:hypothetical protein